MLCLVWIKLFIKGLLSKEIVNHLAFVSIYMIKCNVVFRFWSMQDHFLGFYERLQILFKIYLKL